MPALSSFSFRLKTLASVAQVTPVLTVCAIARDYVGVECLHVFDEVLDEGLSFLSSPARNCFSSPSLVTVEMMMTGFRSGLGEPSRL